VALLIVGGGKMGMSHLAIASTYVGKDNIGLCDASLVTRLVFRLLGYKVFSSVEKALNGLPPISGVLIATPTGSHAALGKWAIQNRLPCFIEKPLTLNVYASQELKKLADVCGVFVQIGFVLRYVSSFQRLRKLVLDKKLGKVISYSGFMKGNVMSKPPSPGSWQGISSLGGGSLNEYGPHLIDLTRFIFGPVDNVTNVKSQKVFCSSADDRIDFEFLHTGGVAGKLEINWCDSSMRKSTTEFLVKFELGEVRVDSSSLEFIVVDDRSGSVGSYTELDRKLSVPNVNFYLRGEEFSLQLEYFLSKCIKPKVAFSPHAFGDVAAGLDDGLAVDKLIEIIASKAGLE